MLFVMTTAQSSRASGKVQNLILTAIGYKEEVGVFWNLIQKFRCLVSIGCTPHEAESSVLWEIGMH